MYKSKPLSKSSPPSGGGGNQRAYRRHKLCIFPPAVSGRRQSRRCLHRISRHRRITPPAVSFLAPLCLASAEGGLFCARGISRRGGTKGCGHGPQDERLRPPGGRTDGPTISFRRRSRHGASAPRRQCGVRRREPVGRATGVYSIKRGPHCAARSGEQRDGAAWRYQRKIVGGHEAYCPT